MEVLSRGAEGTLYIKDEKTLVKIREEKPYRHPTLDKKLRLSRTKREFKVLTKLLENDVKVPEVRMLDKDNCSFELAFLEGSVLKKVLDENFLKEAFKEIMKIHKLDIVHGDLTTLNMIVSKEKVFIIDFGLAEFTHKIEDKAVDLNLFFTCLKNEHPDFFHFKDQLLETYSTLEFGEDVVKQLQKVEHRGRNK